MTYTPTGLKKIFHQTRRFLAKKWLSLMPALQIGITGSIGKTITTQMIYRILNAVAPTVVTDINLDTIYNVPITALKVTPWTKFAVFELGIDKPAEMEKHLEIVSPKIAIITGISPVHTDAEHLGSLENVIKEKRKLIEALPKNGLAILNYDDKNVRQMAPYTKAKILFYGTDKNHCHVWADKIKISLDGTSFNCHFNIKKILSNNKFLKDLKNFHQTEKISTKLIGYHHVYTIMAALSAVINAYTPNLMYRYIEIIKNSKPLPGRMSVEEGPLKTIILNDSLRASPASTKTGLENLSQIEYKKGRKIAVLAEMGELQYPEEEHKKIGKLLSKLNIDYVINIGNLQLYTYQSAIKNGFSQKRIFWAENVIEAADILKKIIQENDLIYLKGSLLRHVERVLLIIEGKKVKCNVIFCPFYHPCQKCQYLSKGYQNVQKNISKLI